LYSGIFRWLVDRDLAGARVEALPIRFVAVATGLRENQSPQAHVITRGTVGEAVQASGSAPVGFAPTDKLTATGGPMRYVDGALAAMVPARILKDFGADYVFAFNCLAGPERRNPLGSSLLGKLAYACTPVGRLIDLWVSGAYLIELASRETSEDAHIYYDPDRVEVPLAESFCFYNAEAIVKQAARSKRLRQRINDCARFWQMIKERGDEASAVAARGDGGGR
jgi:predicted acylesterase/phospholipase RssA